MQPTDLPGEAWAALGAVLTAVVATGGTVVVHLRGARANAENDQTPAGWEKLADRLDAEIDRLNKDLSHERTQREDLTQRFVTLEAELTESRASLRLAIGYIERLLGWVSAHVPVTGIPPIPTELEKHR